MSAYGFVEKMSSFQEISEHGTFHGITIQQENKPLNIKDKKGLFAIEWEWPGNGRQYLALAGLNKTRMLN
ncbi:MAG: hypothetical protein AB1Z31_17410 [Desulfobacterales bacterium]